MGIQITMFLFNFHVKYQCNYEYIQTMLKNTKFHKPKPKVEFNYLR